MSKEYLQYNPANFKPENLMRPPTGIVSDELMYLCNQLRNAIEGGLRVDKDTLKIGTELEILFFDKNADPGKLEKVSNKEIQRQNRHSYDELSTKEEDEIRRLNNPNYTSGHRAKVLKVANFAEKLEEMYPDDFYECTRDSKLLIEFRTAPRNLEAHLENVSWLADAIRAKASKLGLLPVVHSQHIHLSCNSHNIRLNTKGRYKFINSENFNGGYIDRTFTRILPLVMLPEEYEEDDRLPHVVRENNAGEDRANHPEFRQLSSEYAHDHVLNLTLCLRSLYASLRNPDYATDTLPDGKYLKAVKEMSTDEELALFFGDSTLAKICKVAKQYPAVSRRDKTINEVK